MVYLRNIQAALGWIWFAMLWAFPVAVLAIAYYLLPSLHQPASFRIPDQALRSLFAIGVAGTIWLGFQFWTAANRETTTKALQADHAFAIIIFTVIAILAGYEAGRGTLQFWVIPSLVLSFLDAFLSGMLAINNATQKPVFNTAPGA